MKEPLNDNKTHCIDDHIPTDEELEKELADVPEELKELWHKQFEEWKNIRKEN